MCLFENGRRHSRELDDKFIKTRIDLDLKHNVESTYEERDG